MLLKNLVRIFVIAVAVVMSAAQYGLAQEKINVVTTIGQITDAVKNIGGDRVTVKGLMGAGVDPHLYKATEGDVTKLAKAQIILFNGLHLEAKMAEIMKKMSRTKKTVAVAEAIPADQLLQSEISANQHDPHVWFDVDLWIIASGEVKKALVEFDSAGKEYYEERYTKYEEELKKLNEYVKNKSAELAPEQRILVTANDAFRYFGRKYGFTVVGLQGISTESEAGARDVSNLAQFIVDKKVKAIFVESSVPERNIKAVQEAVKARGWEVTIGGELFSDAMGTEDTFEGTYVGMITTNINTIVDALKGHHQ